MDIISTITENSRNSVKELICMGWEHIENDFGGGTCERLIKLFDEFYDATENNHKLETEESSWRLDLARLNVYNKINWGLRISSGLAR